MKQETASISSLEAGQRMVASKAKTPASRPLPPAREQVNGVLIVDKSEGITSFSAAAKVRRMLGQKKAGHCGALDPFATGVLVVCLNQATRIADHFLSQEKEYRFTVRFGVETDTLDKTGQVVRTWEGAPIAEETLMEGLEALRRARSQRTPIYAAARVNGRRLYEYARRGEQVELPEREITIHRLDLLSYQWPETELVVRCSKGTYVRQMAADLGSALGCGAHVTRLRRLASGQFRIEQAIPLTDVSGAEDFAERAMQGMISMNDALAHLPAIAIEDRETLARLRNGGLDPEWERRCRDDLPPHPGPFRLTTPQSRLLALWRPNPVPGQGRRLRLFNE